MPLALTRLLEATAVTRRMLSAVWGAGCEAGDAPPRRENSGTTTPAAGKRPPVVAPPSFRRVEEAATKVANAFAQKKSVGAWCSVRESVRVAAAERGAGEAVACCALIARQCGMPV